jgi:integration host factor subunit alpha
LLEIIQSTLASGDDVPVSGFGKYCVKEKKNEKAGIRPPEMMRFYRPDEW